MNTLQKSLIALAVGSLLSVGAQAAIYNTGTAVGQPYVGAKVGQIDATPERGSLEKPTAYGIYAGYNFDPNFGAEVEYLGSDKVDYTYSVNNVQIAKGEGDVKTYGAYGTYRYYLPNTNFYGKGKIGIAKTDVSASTIANNSDKNSTGLAGGVGVGFAPTPNVGIEAEYAKVGGDLDAITLGAHFKF